MYASDFDDSNSIIAELPSDDQCLSPESKYSPLTLIKNDSNGMRVLIEDGQLKVEGGRKLKKSELTKIKKIIMKESKSNDDEPSKKEQVTTFMSKYQKSNYTDVPVTDMRHIIPMLLTEVYSSLYGQWSKKVKGLWENRPNDWPDDVPFVDPNNKIKGSGQSQCKPKKDDLRKILLHLVKAYATEQACSAIEPHGSSDPLLSFSSVTMPDKFPVQRQMTISTGDEYATIDSYSYTLLDSGSHLDSTFFDSRQPVAETIGGTVFIDGVQFHLKEDIGQDYERLKIGQHLDDSFSFVNEVPTSEASIGKGSRSGEDDTGVDEVKGNAFRTVGDGSRPQQVQDNEDDSDDSDPIDDLIHRINVKISKLPKTKNVAKGQVAKLRDAHDVVKKMYKQVPLNKSGFLEKAHCLEMAIDIFKVGGALSIAWQQKLQELQVVVVHPSDDLDSQTLQHQDVGDLKVGMSSRGDVVPPTDDRCSLAALSQSRHVDLGLLNIETRQNEQMNLDDFQPSVLELRTEQNPDATEVFEVPCKDFSGTTFLMPVDDTKLIGVPYDELLAGFLNNLNPNELQDLGTTIDVRQLMNFEYDTGPGGSIQESCTAECSSTTQAIAHQHVEKDTRLHNYKSQRFVQSSPSRDDTCWQLVQQPTQAKLQPKNKGTAVSYYQPQAPQRKIYLATSTDNGKFPLTQAPPLSIQGQPLSVRGPLLSMPGQPLSITQGQPWLNELQRPFEDLSLQTKDRPVLTRLLNEPRTVQPRIGEKRKSSVCDLTIDYGNECDAGRDVLLLASKCPPIPIMVADLDDFDGHSFKSMSRKKIRATAMKH